MKLALKIDAATFRGSLVGVPRLVEALRSAEAKASFFFNLGPDRSGRQLGALLAASRRGASAPIRYGLATLFYGTLLPGPDIGAREAPLMRSVRERGFETGIHTWDHIRWQDHVAQASPQWTRNEMRKAVERYAEVFDTAPRTHGAAGWQMNEAAYALEREFGFDYASDGRGTHPFQPVDANGEPFGVPQLPTTLPTLDELIGLDGVGADNVHERVLALTDAAPPQGHVYTLHAELEGMRLAGAFERLLAGWKAQGYRLVPTRTMFDAVSRAGLPRHRVGSGEIAGRSGTLAIQGRCA